MRLILDIPPVNASECVVIYAFVAASHDAVDGKFKFNSRSICCALVWTWKTICPHHHPGLFFFVLRNEGISDEHEVETWKNYYALEAFTIIEKSSQGDADFCYLSRIFLSTSLNSLHSDLKSKHKIHSNYHFFQPFNYSRGWTSILTYNRRLLHRRKQTNEETLTNIHFRHSKLRF